MPQWEYAQMRTWKEWTQDDNGRWQQPIIHADLKMRTKARHALRDNPNMLVELNKLGEEGWELIEIETERGVSSDLEVMPSTSSWISRTLWFKRERPKE